VNIEHLRRSLKASWLAYYRENRSWLVRLGVWVNCDGQRRPSSSFILATLSVLEPQLTQLLPLVVDLNSNPDSIVAVLGLNFSPDSELDVFPANGSDDAMKMLPGGNQAVKLAANHPPSRLPTAIDESCEGVRGQSGIRRRD
jgi:Family of unknown function (DUF5331)